MYTFISELVKEKDGKIKMGLILPNAAAALCIIRQYGLEKYKEADNWQRVPEEDWMDAMYRHLMKYLAGEENDPESGYPHLWHALCNLEYCIEKKYSGLVYVSQNPEK